MAANRNDPDGLASDWAAIGRNVLGTAAGALEGALTDNKGDDRRREEAASRWDWRMFAMILAGVVVAVVIVKKVLK